MKTRNKFQLFWLNRCNSWFKSKNGSFWCCVIGLAYNQKVSRQAFWLILNQKVSRQAFQRICNPLSKNVRPLSPGDLQSPSSLFVFHSKTIARMTVIPFLCVIVFLWKKSQSLIFKENNVVFTWYIVIYKNETFRINLQEVSWKSHRSIIKYPFLYFLFRKIGTKVESVKVTVILPKKKHVNWALGSRTTGT